MPGCCWLGWLMPGEDCCVPCDPPGVPWATAAVTKNADVKHIDSTNFFMVTLLLSLRFERSSVPGFWRSTRPSYAGHETPVRWVEVAGCGCVSCAANDSELLKADLGIRLCHSMHPQHGARSVEPECCR